MIKDVFLQITGEILFSVIEDMNLQIIGDIFLQNLVCIISKLGIYLFAELMMYFCRIEDVFLQNGDGTVSREEFQEMCNNLSPEEVQRVFSSSDFMFFNVVLAVFFIFVLG